MRGNPSYHLGYSPHAPYGELGWSFKKLKSKVKKASKSVKKSSAFKDLQKKTSSVRKSSAFRRMMDKAKTASKSVPKPVRKSTRTFLTRSKALALKKNKAIAAKKAISRRDGTKIPMPFGPEMVYYKGKPILKSRYLSILKSKRRAASTPKPVVKRGPTRQRVSKPVNRALKPKMVVGPVGPRGGSGPTGEQGPRGYPGARGQRGPRGMPGKSISTTDRWKHKLEKDEMRRIYQNRMRLGRERNALINNQLQEMQTRNAILMQRINEQETIAEKNINNATVYKQWHDFKEAAQETVFPKLGGIDIEDEYVASSVSALPWVILGLALITREG